MKRLLKLKFIIPAIVAIAAGITLPIVLTPHKHNVVDETWLNDATNHWHDCAKCEDPVDLAAHEYGEWTNVAGKCQKTKSCLTCGYVVTEDVAHTYDDACDETCNVCGTERSIEHKFGTLIAKVEATCETDGLHAHYKCSDCNSYFDESKKEVSYSTLIIKALDHDYGQLIEEVKPDCLNTGLKAHYKCADCEKYFDAEKKEVTYESLVLDAKGHTTTDVPGLPATCVTDGTVAHKHCSVCEKNFDAEGKELTSVVVPANGHSLTDVPAVEATCEGTGTLAHKHCSSCNKNFDAEGKELTDISVQAKGHNLGELVPAKAATCTETGNVAYKECSVCHKKFDEDGELLETVIVPETGHTLTDVALVEATCTEAGNIAHKHCSVCDKNFDAEENELQTIVIPAKGHTLELVYPITPSCEVDGVKAHQHCTVCEKNYEIKGNISLKYDQYYEYVPSASKVYTVSANGFEYTFGTNWRFFLIVDKDGRIAYMVEHPNYGHGEIKGSTYARHSMYADYNNNPAFANIGTESIDTYNNIGFDLVVPEGGYGIILHNASDLLTMLFGSYSERSTNTASLNVDNLRLRMDPYDNLYAIDLGAELVEMDIVDKALGHTYGQLIAKVEPKCEDTGLEAHYQCAGCDKYFDINEDEVEYDSLVIPATNHTLSKLVAEVPATCEEDGLKAHYTCTVCDSYFDSNKAKVEYETLVIEAKKHDYGTIVLEKTATCEETGLKAHYHCSVCDKYFDTDKVEVNYQSLVIAKVKHELGELIAEVPATCKETGLKAHYICSTCSKYYTADGNETTLEELKIDLTTHSYGNLVAAKSATCEAKGYRAHYYCSVCEKYFDASKAETTYAELELSALGHDYQKASYIWSKDHLSCTATKVCSRNADHIVTETVAATYEVIKEATADEDGLGVYTTSSFEDPDFEVQKWEATINATGHNYGTPSYEWNEDFTECIATAECIDDGCDKVLTEKATISVVTIPATCEADGKITYSPKFSNNLFKTDAKEVTIDKLGHADGKVEYSWNNDKSKCVATLLCANNIEHVIVEEEVVVTVEVVPATCTAAGKTIYTATFKDSRLGIDTKEDPIAKLAHTNSEPTYGWATEYTDYVAEIVCTVCGESQIDEHATITSTTTPATCDTDGKTIYTVEFKNALFKDDTIEVKINKLGHAQGEIKYIWADDYSSCTAECYCANDPKHLYDTETAQITSEITEAKCTVDGLAVYTAKFTKPIFTQQVKKIVLTQPGHSKGTPSYVWADDYSYCTATVLCTVCDEKVIDEKVDSTSTTTATCTTAGQTTYSVDFEDKNLVDLTKTVNTDALGHEYGELVKANDETCTTDGNIAYYQCSSCKEYFNDEKELLDSIDDTVIEALGHDLTITNENVTCSRCDFTRQVYYLRGTMNDWTSEYNYRFRYNEETDTATLIVELYVGEQFKFTLLDGWKVEYGYYSDHVSGKENFVHGKDVDDGEDNDNLMCNVESAYLITLKYVSDGVRFIIEPITHTHTIDENADYTITNTHHYFACTECANGKKDYAEHEFTYKCQTICLTCGHTRVNTTAHTWSNDCDSICNVCSEVREVADHLYGDLIDEVPATCEENGTKEHYKCSKCDVYFDKNKEVLDSIVITAIGHAYDETQWGYKQLDGHAHLCKNGCGTNDDVVKHTEYTDPDTLVTYCSVCKYVLHEHVYDQEKVLDDNQKLAATCVSKAVYYKVCECGAHDKNGETFETGEFGDHSYGSLKSKEAGCETTGLKSHYHCSLCDKYFNEDKELVEYESLITNANGHTYGELLKEDSTCTKAGMVEHYLCHCGQYFDKNKVEKDVSELKAELASHIYEYFEDVYKCENCDTAPSYNNYYIKGLDDTWTPTPTFRFAIDLNTKTSSIIMYLKAGDAFKVGTFDGYEFGYSQSFTGKNLFKESSSFQNIEVKDGTDGVYKFTMSNLNATATLKIEKITDHVHTYNEGDEIVDKNISSHFYNCITCIRGLAEVAHTEEIDTAVDNTCTEDGLTEGKHCSVCEYVIVEQEVVPALKHDFSEENADDTYFAEAATCTSPAKYYKSCSHCGLAGSAIFTIGPNAPHTYNQETVADKYKVSDATCTEPSKYYKSCSCGKAGTEIFENGNALDHDYLDHAAQSATCEDIGWDAYQTCEREGCNYTTYNEIAATGHTWVTGDSLENGKHNEDCSNDNCDASREVNCSFGEWTTVDEPTAEKDGLKQRECQYCEYIEEETIPAQHTCVFAEEYTEIPATCTTDGVKYQKCTVTVKCDKRQNETTLPKINHDFEGVEVDYEWTNDYSTCTATLVCKNNTTDECTITETKARTLDPVVTATCTSAGTITYKVIFDNQQLGETIEVVEQDALQHDWNPITYDWSDDNSSCTATITCKRSDECKISETKNSTIISNTATCEEGGEITYGVTFDNELLGSDEETLNIGKLGHNYIEDTTDDSHLKTSADCTNDAIYYKSCSRCGINSDEEFLDLDSALGHCNEYDYLNGTKKCTVCNNEESLTHDSKTYLPGGFNSWSTTTKMYNVEGKENVVRLDVKLVKGVHIFKIIFNGGWYGNSGTITENITGWEFKTSISENCRLNVEESAIYSFEFNTSTKKLDVKIKETVTIDNVYYLQAGQKWPEANAWIAAYTFEGSKTTWYKMLQLADNNYYFIKEDNYTNIIFVRKNPNNTNFDWNDVWAQTPDLKIPTDGKYTYKIVEWHAAGSGWI